MGHWLFFRTSWSTKNGIHTKCATSMTFPILIFSKIDDRKTTCMKVIERANATKIVEQPALLLWLLLLCRKVYEILSGGGGARGVRFSCVLVWRLPSLLGLLQWLYIHGHLAVQHHHGARDAMRNLFALAQQVLQQETHFTWDAWDLMTRAGWSPHDTDDKGKMIYS